ncbi:hypothetical protein ACMA5I_09770 [Paracoccaceae bacterium GXU_MW_L88]
MKRTIACLKWGTKFPPDYVNVLHRACRANLKGEFRFVCMTDDGTGLDPEIDVLPFPDFKVPRKTWRHSCFPKIGLLAPGVLDDDEVVLHLDLDILVRGDLQPFFDLYAEKPAFYSLREWNPAIYRTAVPLSMRPDRGTQGSVYLYRVGDQRHMFHEFNDNIEWVFANYRSDRQYFPTIAKDPTYFPYDWIVSFKNHCLWYWPLNKVFTEPKAPASSKIVVFHGDPKPSDLFGPDGRRWGTSRKFGFGPVPWVRDYWTGYGGRLDVDTGPGERVVARPE